MRRRSRAGGKPSETRRRKTATPKHRGALKDAHRASAAGLQEQLDSKTKGLDEALEQLNATAEVLRVISYSPGELEPVFRAMLENATRICGANFASLFRLVNGELQVLSALNIPPALTEFLRDGRHRLTEFNAFLRVSVSRKPLHITDYRLDEAYLTGDPIAVAGVELGTIRTLLIVPLLKDNELVGTFGIFRQEVLPFTDKQIALVQNFAAQAVIAIENTRLLNELRRRTTDLTESLEQQTATSEVLKVISSSPGDLESVFEVLLDNATRMCGANFGALSLREGEAFRSIANIGAPPAFAERRRHDPLILPTPGHNLERLLLTKDVVHIPDLESDKAAAPVPYEYAGARAALNVPLLKDDEVIGSLLIYRQEKGSFGTKQIELVQNFAAQAVIAIENARLLKELRQRTGDLASSLYELRAAQDRLVQTEKLASLGQLTAGIAHEIKNPLNFVNNFSELSIELIDELADGLKGVTLDDKQRSEFGELTETLRRNLQKVVQHGQRADSIVKNMLLHSRAGSGEHQPVAINALVEESLNLAYHGARAEKQDFNITLESSFDPAAGEVDLFPQEITRVLLNLISNGFYAAIKRKMEVDDGGYEPTLAAATKNLGDRVEIRIRDNGNGIPPEVKDKMFNPFFTTKPAGEGTGLGLSISHDIVVKQHGGSIEVDTMPGEFTEFRIVLPRTGASTIKTREQA